MGFPSSSVTHQWDSFHTEPSSNGIPFILSQSGIRFPSSWAKQQWDSLYPEPSSNGIPFILSQAGIRFPSSWAKQQWDSPKTGCLERVLSLKLRILKNQAEYIQMRTNVNFHQLFFFTYLTSEKAFSSATIICMANSKEIRSKLYNLVQVLYGLCI